MIDRRDSGKLNKLTRTIDRPNLTPDEREKPMRNMFLLGGANKMFECEMIP